MVPDLVGYLTLDNLPNVSICISAQKELGFFISITDDENTYLTLGDKNALNETVDVWGDGLYISKGLFIPFPIAWKGLEEYMLFNKLSDEIKWITSDERTFNQDNGYSATDFCPNLANNSETSEYLKNYTVICIDNTTYPSGVCGDNLTWIFNKETNTLTISGTGDMYDYEINDVSGFINQPWYDFSRNIKHIVIADFFKA